MYLGNLTLTYNVKLILLALGILSIMCIKTNFIDDIPGTIKLTSKS